MKKRKHVCQHSLIIFISNKLLMRSLEEQALNDLNFDNKRVAYDYLYEVTSSKRIYAIIALNEYLAILIITIAYFNIYVS